MFEASLEAKQKQASPRIAGVAHEVFQQGATSAQQAPPRVKSSAIPLAQFATRDWQSGVGAYAPDQADDQRTRRHLRTRSGPGGRACDAHADGSPRIVREAA